MAGKPELEGHIPDYIPVSVRFNTIDETIEYIRFLKDHIDDLSEKDVEKLYYAVLWYELQNGQGIKSVVGYGPAETYTNLLSFVKLMLNTRAKAFDYTYRLEYDSGLKVLDYIPRSVQFKTIEETVEYIKSVSGLDHASRAELELLYYSIIWLDRLYELDIDTYRIADQYTDLELLSNAKQLRNGVLNEK